MSLSVQNNLNKLSPIQRYINTSAVQNTFSIRNNSETSSVSTVKNICNVNYGDDYEQMLIEDRKVYDSQKKYGELDNVEFGSKEWDSWKTKNAKSFFPPLDAPVKVRQTFREAKESIPADDKKARMDFDDNCGMLFLYTLFPSDAGLPDNFKLNTISDYESLFNFHIQKNMDFSKLFTGSNKEQCISSINFAESIKNKLQESLLGL